MKYCFLLAILFAFNVMAQPNTLEIVRVADQARGGGLIGLVWEVRTHSTGGNLRDPVDQVLSVKAVNMNSVAEVLEPPSSKGTKILQVERNMWFSKPGLKKPVVISPRQRLTGQASIGDIAATNYAKHYTATYLHEEKIVDELCHVLDLKASSHQSTYDRIIYWVSVKRGLAVQAHFLSLSGKKLKSASFEYDNSISVEGRKVAFISRMLIADVLTDAKTDMLFSRVIVKPVASSEFDVSNLQ
jgi:Outer membrane lipoprotein-sorting protein